MRLRLLALAVPMILAVGAAPARADWLPLPGLSAPGAGWVRDYVTSVAQPAVIYAPTEGSGVYRSVNNGGSWAAFNSGLEGIPGAKDVRTVYISGSTTYAGTSVGLFKSVGGGSWQPVAQGPEPDPGKATRLNKAVQTVYSPLVGRMLAGVASGGIYSSGDGGATWQPPAPGNGMSTSETVWSIGSLVPGVLFAATSSGVYRSLDNGSTWSLASDGISGTVLRVFADEKAPNIFYASGSGGVFRTINAGITWSNVEGPADHRLGGGQVRALQQFTGVNETRLYAGTENGVYAGTTGHGLLPGPVRWRKVSNAGLGNNTIVWALKSFTTTPGVLWAGTQSNGGYALVFTPPVNTASPTISGTLQVGKTLTAAPGTWTGTETIEYEYQWQYCTSTTTSSCHDIADATDKTYVLTTGEQNDRMRVVVTASNDFPSFGLITAASAISGSTVGAAPGSIAGANVAPSPGVTAPTLPQSGDTITATTPNFNPAATSFKFQWYRCNSAGANCSPLAGATAQSYTLTDDDVDSKLCATATGSNANGATTTGCGTLTNIVLAPNPVQLKPTTLAGSAWVGETLVSGVGAWAYPGTTYVRQWESCEADGSSCQTISGSKAAGYVVKAGDRGHRLRVRISVDSNGPNQYPGPVEVFTPLSDVVTDRPAPPADPTQQGGGGGGGAGGGGGQGSQPAPDTVAPVLQSLGAVSAKLKPGAQLKLKVALNEGGTLRVDLQRVRAGRKVGKACKPGAHKGRKCTAITKVGTVTVAVGGSGVVALPKRKLAAGDYRAVVTPFDAAGNRGASRTITFKVRKK